MNSLVAYDGSSSSEDDSTDDCNKFHQKRKITVEVSGQRPEHKDTNTEANVLLELKGLPAPKRVSGDVASADDELEDEVKPKAYQVQYAPEPPRKKNRFPAKITIPSVDYDSDEEHKSRQKKKKGEGRSGLTSILPPPIHSVLKEPNRTLLPSIFMKKKDSVKNISNTIDLINAKSALSTNSDNEDDFDCDDGHKFFSLNTKDKVNSNLQLFGGKNVTISSSVKPISLYVDGFKEHTLYTADINNTETTSVLNSSSIIDTTSDDTAAKEDVPLSFNPSMKYNKLNNTLKPFTKVAGPEPFQQKIDELENSCTTDEGLFSQEDHEFLRLQGKNLHGKEVIQFIDINADDYVSTTAYQKSFSEESSYTSSHKKKDGPTSQQKRKHQITYLAHQAKERELELKNAWSQGKMTKKQTQAKYGF